jgi:hypothetical protein
MRVSRIVVNNRFAGVPGKLRKRIVKKCPPYAGSLVINAKRGLREKK